MTEFSMEMWAAMDMAMMGMSGRADRELRGVGVQPGGNLICNEDSGEDRDISSQALLRLLVRAAALPRNLLAGLQQGACYGHCPVLAGREELDGHRVSPRNAIRLGSRSCPWLRLSGCIGAPAMTLT